MKKIFFIFLTLLLFYSLSLKSVQAKKKIIRKSTSTGTVATGSRLVISPRLRGDRKALIINFSNLGAVSSFFYSLEYVGNGLPQGVAGTVTSTGEQSTQRELLFGTCSKNVCRYHTGITGMKFVVTSTLTSGTRVRKTYRIRV